MGIFDITFRQSRTRRRRRKARSRPRKRFGERLRNYFFIFLKLNVAACALFGASMLGLKFNHFLFQSSFFHLTRVEFSGGHESIQRELLSLAEIQPDNELNLLQLQPEKIAQAMQQHPRVKKIRVKRIPPETLKVSVEQRQPVAIIACDNLYPIDREGVVLDDNADLEKQSDLDLPFITGIQDHEIFLGHPVRSSALQDIVQTILHLDEIDPGLYKRFSEFTITQGDEINAVLRNGLQVRFGAANPLERMAYLEAFLKEYPRLDRFEYVDLRFNKQIVYLPQSASN